MSLDSCTKEIQNVIDTDFSNIADIPTIRASLIKLADEFRSLKVSLLFSNITDTLGDDSLTTSEFFQALAFIESASHSFKKSALHLDTK